LVYFSSDFWCANYATKNEISWVRKLMQMQRLLICNRECVHQTSTVAIALHEAIKGNFPAAWFYTLSHTLFAFRFSSSAVFKIVFLFLPHLAAQRNKTAFVHKTEKAHAKRQRDGWIF